MKEKRAAVHFKSLKRVYELLHPLFCIFFTVGCPTILLSLFIVKPVQAHSPDPSTALSAPVCPNCFTSGQLTANEGFIILISTILLVAVAILVGILFYNRSLAKKVNEQTREIKSNEMKFRSIFDTSGIGITTVDENGTFLTANPTTLRLLGYSAEEFARLSIRDITHPDDMARNFELFKDLWAGRRGSYTIEKRDRHKDGHYIWGRVTASMVHDNDGKPLFAIALFDDITDSRNAEVFRSAIFKISQTVTATSTLEAFYASIHSILGELMPVDNFFIALYHAEDGLLHFPFVKDQYDSSTEPIEPGKTLSNYVMNTREPTLVDGDVFDSLLEKNQVVLVGTKPVEWLGVPLIIDDQVFGVMVTQHYDTNFKFNKFDIDLFTFVSSQVAQAIDKKRTEDALIQSDSDMRALFGAMTEIVMVLDQEGCYKKIVGTNNNLLYRPPNELLGRTLHEVFEKERADTFLRYIRETLTTHKKTAFEYSLTIQNKVLWFAATLSPVTEDTVIWVARDITNRKVMEEELRDNEARYRTIFEDSPVSLWEEDFSQVLQQITLLKHQGVVDFRAYFRAHPGELSDLISKIKILDVNEAALKLVHAGSKTELIKNFSRVIGDDSYAGIVQQIEMIAAGKSEFDLEG